ncbi:MAG: hypothetical protein NTY88_11330 [Bacteroidetes bacterium]|nr:hypothetical protein [Bacteroidota bacterium]
MLDKNVIGLRYSHRNYFSETPSSVTEQNGTVTNQYLNSIEIFGRFNLNKRIQLSVFLPVSFIKQTTESATQKAAGLGDMSFLLQYNLVNPLKYNSSKFKHRLQLGIGTKLPSGEFKMNADDMFNTTLQLGTGSVDFLTNAVYVFRFKNFGVNTNASYKLNTTNTKGYRFGDKIQAGTNYFYVFNVKKVQLMPSVGLHYEYQFSHKKDGETLGNTGGYFLTTSVGFDIYYKQFAFSSSVSPALMNHLNWQGENKNKFNLEAGVFFNFLTNKKQ